jgi:outer membrane protein assembly factor BamE (lipoprotein component of BamABCDE complex)
MKKIIVVSLVMLLFSCGTQQKLLKSFELKTGMTKDQVITIMGNPVKNDFNKNIEEWHYCKTGISADEFIALFFFEGKLIAKKNYTVTLADTRGAGGSCEKFIKLGNYREPDVVTEIRLKH